MHIFRVVWPTLTVHSSETRALSPSPLYGEQLSLIISLLMMHQQSRGVRSLQTLGSVSAGSKVKFYSLLPGLSTTGRCMPDTSPKIYLKPKEPHGEPSSPAPLPDLTKPVLCFTKQIAGSCQESLGQMRCTNTGANKEAFLSKDSFLLQ